MIRVEGTRLYVSELDAINGTPAPNIKPVMIEFLSHTDTPTQTKGFPSQMKSRESGAGSILGTVAQLGPVYELEAKFAEAEVMYRKSVEANQAMLPRGHLALIASLNDLALYYERWERLDEAETYYKAALNHWQPFALR